MPTLHIQVFGKERDLRRAIVELTPAAVMAPALVLESLGMEPAVRGVRRGKMDEPYVLISVGHSVSPDEMQGEIVGALGLLRRGEMKVFCARLLGTGQQRIKTVTKFADLLPLLQFKSARGVVLPARFSNVVTGRSRLHLVVHELPHGRVALTSLAFSRSNYQKMVMMALNNLDDSLKNSLGVDAWK